MSSSAHGGVERKRALNAAIQRSPGCNGEALNTSTAPRSGRRPVGGRFRPEDGLLVIDNVPGGRFTLEIRNTCAPDRTPSSPASYTSGGGFFTQCEAEGFRRITYFLDRPDVMAEYTVTMRANKAAYPVLLSNGNLVEQGDLGNGRHFARWHDPFPKPSYLFALVAANLVAREQHIRSRGGKDHLLQVWVRRGDLDKTEHAMNSLVARWSGTRPASACPSISSAS
jgi:aminopeptidase N